MRDHFVEVREGEQSIIFLFYGREIGCWGQKSFGGKRWHHVGFVNFFNSFILSPVTRGHLDTRPPKRRIIFN